MISRLGASAPYGLNCFFEHVFSFVYAIDEKALQVHIVFDNYWHLHFLCIKELESAIRYFYNRLGALSFGLFSTIFQEKMIY